MEYNFKREHLTDEQELRAIDYASSLLSNIITDTYDREEVMDAIGGDIIADIEECAEWQSLDEDEWCEADVEYALGRVLKNKICG